MINNSHHVGLEGHRPYEPGKENTPEIEIVERMRERVRMKDTDLGISLQNRIEDLQELLAAYRGGMIKETDK